MKKYIELDNQSEQLIHIACTQPIKRETKKIKSVMKRPHHHSHFEIVNIRTNSENEYIHIEDKKFRLTSNTVGLIPPHVTHMTERLNNSGRMILSIQPQYLYPVFDFLGLNVTGFFSRRVILLSDSQMNHLYSLSKKMILTENASSHSIAALNTDRQMKILTCEFIDILSNHMHLVSPMTTYSLDNISEIEKYIKANYSAPLSLEQLSQKFKMDKFTMCRKFKAQNNITIQNFIQNIRINAAKDLLENTTVSVAVISENTGFSTSAYFSSAFKKICGISPTDYRDKYLNGKL